MQTVTVKTNKPYAVKIGRGALKFLSCYLEEQGFCGKIMVVSDKKVSELHYKKLSDCLSGENVILHTVPEKEAAKTVEEYLSLVKNLEKHKFGRGDIVISFGGGSVGDLAAFAAATYFRGIRLIHVPTTLLAMCDSSIGGKCGVDFMSKNDLGCFYQPELVVADLEFLDTLPESQFKCGMAEILKCAVISPIEPSLFDDEKANLEHLVSLVVAFKARIVESDEHDRSARHVLNFGHTFAHAVELASAFKVPHGQAVAIGMSLITSLARQNGLVGPDMPNVVDGLIQKIGLETESPYPVDELLPYVACDKKVSGESIKIVIAPKLHECKIISVTLESFLGGGKWILA